MFIRWIYNQERETLFLSQQTLQKLNIISPKITIHLGAWKRMLKVRPHKELNDETIGLPHYLSRTFSIPDILPYDMYMEGNNLYLGPVIAIVVRKGTLSQKRLGFWTDYCRNYPEIRGLIYFCMVKGIDMSAKTISGYYYDPDSEGTEQWKSGIFPYPGVVYQRTRIPRGILKDLRNHADAKVFNARLFNKWEMWDILSEAGFTHTPHTVRLNGLDSLEQMLSLYKSVYLKPVQGRFGIGIQKIEKRPDGYLFKEGSGIDQRVDNPAQVFQLIGKYKKKRKYIIQQGVPLTFQDKPVDFRVILQKDGSREWTCSGIIAKLGYQGSLYTNTPSTIYLISEALQTIYGLTPEQALDKENEIIRICTEACQIIERAYGIYADVGIDVVVDGDLNIWILEINKIHQHTMIKYLGKDPDMYHRVVSKPLAYAKALAGFK